MYRNVVYNITEDWKGEIIFFGWDDKGNPTKETIPWQSHLYFEDPHGHFKSIFNTKLKRLEFDSIIGRKRWVESHPTTKIYDCNNPVREFLNSRFSGQQKFQEFAKFPLRTHFLDLEISVEDEFPEPSLAAYPINAITIYDTYLKKYFTWALGEVQTDKFTDIVKCFNNEKTMMLDFLGWFEKNYPDILSGWNTMFFDIPYVVNRLKIILPSDVNRLSPIGKIFPTVKISKAMKRACFVIHGISHLDYLFLYRDKFMVEKHFSYSLKEIAKLEDLGVEKMEYEGTFKDFWKNDFERFLSYNRRDVEVLKLMDEKRHLLDAARQVCNLGLCEYETIYSSIPYIYNAIVDFETNRTGKMMPAYYRASSEEVAEDEEYAGGFVFETIFGSYKRGVVSVDFNSLYPNVAIALNLSPETKFAKIISKDLEADQIVLKLPDKTEKIIDKKQLAYLLKEKCTLASNHVMYFKSEVKKGAIPAFLENLYAERKTAKSKMHKIQNEIQKLEEEVAILEQEENSHK